MQIGPSSAGFLLLFTIPGASVVITGKGFGSNQGNSTVTFGGVAAGKAKSWAEAKIVVRVPSTAKDGDVVVKVSTVPNEDLISVPKDSLTPAEFTALSDIPPELEWLANITNAKTRHAYKVDVAEFMAFSGLTEIKSLRAVARTHVIDWRKDMAARSLAATSIRRKLSALSSLFDYLCERNAVLGNPVDGVKRPGLQ